MKIVTVYISQPILNVPLKHILETRHDAEKRIMELIDADSIEFTSRYTDEQLPNHVNADRQELYQLSRGIDLITISDYIYKCVDTEYVDKCCVLEQEIADTFGVPVISEEHNIRSKIITKEVAYDI